MPVRVTHPSSTNASLLAQHMQLRECKAVHASAAAAAAAEAEERRAAHGKATELARQQAEQTKAALEEELTAARSLDIEKANAEVRVTRPPSNTH